MTKKTYLILVALCIFNLGEAKSQGDLKNMEHNFQLQKLLENSDAIISGYPQYKHNDFQGKHYLIKDAVALKGCMDDKTPFIVVPTGMEGTNFIAEFYAAGSTFDESLYLFFLKKTERDDKWYEEKKRKGDPYRIVGITHPPFGVIPLEENAQLINIWMELGQLKSVDQVDEDFIREIPRTTKLSEANVERLVNFFRQEYEEQEDIDAEELRRMKQKTKKVNDSLKAIKKLYGIDVPEEKDTFIAALKLLIDKKEPDEETPKDVREMVEKLKSVNWSELEEKRSRPPFDEKREDNGEEDLGIIFESE